MRTERENWNPSDMGAYALIQESIRAAKLTTPDPVRVHKCNIKLLMHKLTQIDDAAAQMRARETIEHLQSLCVQKPEQAADVEIRRPLWWLREIR